MGRKQVFEDSSLIIDSAFDMIMEEGFPNFTTRKLAKKLGISKTTAYNYLQNKENIIELVVEKAKKIFHKDVLDLIGSRNYKINHFFDLLLIIAEVIYDSVIKYGDIYKLAYRELGKAYDNNVSVEEKFKIYQPVLINIFKDFKYSDFPEFNSQDFLDRFHYLTVLINHMAVIELNRENKIGKERHMELVRKAWTLITQKPLPW